MNDLLYWTISAILACFFIWMIIPSKVNALVKALIPKKVGKKTLLVIVGLVVTVATVLVTVTSNPNQSMQIAPEGKRVLWIIGTTVLGLVVVAGVIFGAIAVLKSPTSTSAGTASTTTPTRLRFWTWVKATSKIKVVFRIGLTLLAYIILNVTVATLYPKTFSWFWTGVFSPGQIFGMHVLAVLGIIGLYCGSAPTDKPIHWMGGAILCLVLLAFVMGAWGKNWSLPSGDAIVAVASNTHHIDHQIDGTWNGKGRMTVVAPIDKWSDVVKIPSGKIFHLDEPQAFYISKNGIPLVDSDGKEKLFEKDDQIRLGNDCKTVQFKSGSGSPLTMTIEFMDMH